MQKVFYLKNCGTCTKIMSRLNLAEWELREVKTVPLNEEELEEMYAKTNSYEELFSKRSTQIKARGLDVKMLKEEDFRRLILDHYSFLKRPVFLTDSEIFVGNSKKAVEQIENYFNRQ